jgi:hypothetical protein
VRDIAREGGREGRDGREGREGWERKEGGRGGREGEALTHELRHPTTHAHHIPHMDTGTDVDTCITIRM